eukprot:2813032-Rhodomonas_salina.1
MPVLRSQRVEENAGWTPRNPIPETACIQHRNEAILSIQTWLKSRGLDLKSRGIHVVCAPAQEVEGQAVAEGGDREEAGGWQRVREAKLSVGHRTVSLSSEFPTSWSPNS